MCKDSSSVDGLIHAALPQLLACSVSEDDEAEVKRELSYLGGTCEDVFQETNKLWCTRPHGYQGFLALLRRLVWERDQRSPLKPSEDKKDKCEPRDFHTDLAEIFPGVAFEVQGKAFALAIGRVCEACKAVAWDVFNEAKKVFAARRARAYIALLKYVGRGETYGGHVGPIVCEPEARKSSEPIRAPDWSLWPVSNSSLRRAMATQMVVNVVSHLPNRVADHLPSSVRDLEVYRKRARAALSARRSAKGALPFSGDEAGWFLRQSPSGDLPAAVGPFAAHALARVYLARGLWVPAESEASSAWKLSPPEFKREAAVRLAEVFQDSGRFYEARELLAPLIEKNREIGGPSFWAAYHMAICDIRCDRFAQATEILHRLLELKPKTNADRGMLASVRLQLVELAAAELACKRPPSLDLAGCLGALNSVHDTYLKAMTVATVGRFGNVWALRSRVLQSYGRVAEAEASALIASYWHEEAGLSRHLNGLVLRG